MSEAKDQLCSVQCFGCRGNISCNLPWRKMTDDTDNDNDSDNNKDNNRTQCLKGRACLSRRCGHPIIIYIFYTLIMISGLIFVAALAVLLRCSIPGTPCKKRSRYFQYDDSYGSWSQLINVQVPMSTYDITGLTSNCLIILFSVLSIIAIHKRKKIIIYAVDCLVIVMAVVLMVYTRQMRGFYKRDWDNAPDLSIVRLEVHDKLKASLYQYDNSNPDVKTIWDNTMIGGCCCGANSYRDFLEIGKEIPVSCKCKPASPPKGNYYTTCYNEHIYCDNDATYNVTSRGCFDYIMWQVEPDRADLHVDKMNVFMYVSTAQLVLVIFAMIFTFFIPLFDRTSGQADDLPAPDKASSDNGIVKFASLPEPVDTKADVSSGAA